MKMQSRGTKTEAEICERYRISSSYRNKLYACFPKLEPVQFRLKESQRRTLNTISLTSKTVAFGFEIHAGFKHDRE